jgi:formate--tetrahydrofolate ligase
MTDDNAIARAATLEPIGAIARKLGIGDDDLIPYGRDKAKVGLDVLGRPRARPGKGKLVLVSAITPTPAGEGKTTTSIGLAQGLARLGESVALALREPSLGPCMGVKGGATGGGAAQIGPADDINLHFTGDMHAVTAAHNLIAAALDNHLHHATGLDIDPQRVLWRRVIDMNDRSLRNIIIGLGGVNQGIPRETGFDITAASEVMAMLCLADDPASLRARIERALVAFDRSGTPITVGDLGVVGAVMALLRDAMLPNLVQTLDGVPALVHGGPFANIAHGCSSVIASRMATHLADWAITEAGFGFDLGAEKFFDIKCVSAGLDVECVVLVATARALKMHGGVEKGALERPDVEAVRRGLVNLDAHLDNIARFDRPVVVAINRFASDTSAELEVIAAHCAERGVAVAASDHHARGGEGAQMLARAVVATARPPSAPLRPLYEPADRVEVKVEKVARAMYGAAGVELSRQATRDIAEVERLGLSHLPVCIAKTQSSLSDDPALRGRPRGFEVMIDRVIANAGAGFLVVITGTILRMPGLPRHPQAERIDLVDGKVTGLM